MTNKLDSIIKYLKKYGYHRELVEAINDGHRSAIEAIINEPDSFKEEIDNMISHGQNIYSLKLADGNIIRTEIPLNDFFVEIIKEKKIKKTGETT